MNKFSKVFLSVVPASVVASFATIASLADEADLAEATSYTVASDIATVTGALGAFNTTNLLSIITAALGIAIPLVILWFGFRWVWRKVKGALKRGS